MGELMRPPILTLKLLLELNWISGRHFSRHQIARAREAPRPVGPNSGRELGPIFSSFFATRVGPQIGLIDERWPRHRTAGP